MRIVHTSDWHIGRLFGRFSPRIQTYLGDQRVVTVGNLARFSAEKEVDAILVAGDIFDREDVSDTLVEKLLAQLEKFSGWWIFIPGNHDRANLSFWWRQDLPKNVIRLLEPRVLWNDPEGRFTIFPAPFQVGVSDPLAALEEAPAISDRIALGLGHGSFKTNPILKNLDYVALGHWHSPHQISLRCWYSGTPEVEEFSDKETIKVGQTLLVTIRGKGGLVKVEPVSIGAYQWATHFPDTLEALERYVTTFSAPEKTCLRASRFLLTAPDMEVRIERLKEYCRTRFFWSDIEDLLTPTLSLEKMIEGLKSLSASMPLVRQTVFHLASREDLSEDTEEYQALLFLYNILTNRDLP